MTEIDRAMRAVVEAARDLPLSKCSRELMDALDKLDDAEEAALYVREKR